MTKKEKLLVIVIVGIIFIAVQVFIIVKINESDEQLQEDKVTLMLSLIEAAYFEGQKDALNGDIRIQHDEDCIYSWKTSPWVSGAEPTFDPAANPNIEM